MFRLIYVPHFTLWHAHGTVVFSADQQAVFVVSYVFCHCVVCVGYVGPVCMMAI